MSRRLRDISGQRTARLVPQWPVGRHKNGHILWLCVCDCGNLSICQASKLIRGSTKSCGCFRKEFHDPVAVIPTFKIEPTITHGMRHTRTYTIWRGIKDRCFNPNSAAFHRYGGRGIQMAPHWAGEFTAFFRDMGECPPGLSIERIDNDGNYEPGNCKWATPAEQNLNKHGTKTLTIGGITKPLVQWARERGLKPRTVRLRLAVGWSTEESLLPTGN